MCVFYFCVFMTTPFAFTSCDVFLILTSMKMVVNILKMAPLHIGSVVSLTCMDARSRVMHYARDATDEFGQFDFSVNLNTNYGKKVDPKLCRARLVSSPDPSCNVLTDFAGGLTGARLSSPSSVYRSTIKYTLGPFYFTTPMCEKPDTSNYSQDDNNGYGNNGQY